MSVRRWLEATLRFGLAEYSDYDGAHWRRAERTGAAAAGSSSCSPRMRSTPNSPAEGRTLDMSWLPSCIATTTTTSTSSLEARRWFDSPVSGVPLRSVPSDVAKWTVKSRKRPGTRRTCRCWR